VSLLHLLILTPLVFAVAIAMAPARLARTIATIGALVPFGPLLVALVRFDWSNGGVLQFASSVDWIADMGLRLGVGVDSVSLLLIALTILLGPICVIGSYTAVKENQKVFYGWLTGLQAAMVGVFAATDLIGFYVCFEFTLLPMYVLINLFGSSNRKRAATKFFLYTFTGSIIALAGLVYVVFHHRSVEGVWTFDIPTLSVTAMQMPVQAQALVLLALMLGFAVKVPLFPVHTWLPLAHTEAPTAGSVILAGVLLKLGTYGIYRFVLGFVPEAVIAYAPLIAVLSIIGIVYAGLICWVQKDVKKLVAYSSVSHLGFCVLGLFALNNVGATGSVLYMINHGLSTGALFLCIGMIYERYHTRSMDELGGLASTMPIWSSFMVFFVMASVGLPGLNGFVSEFMCIIGTFQSSPAWVLEGRAGAAGGSLGPWFAFFAGTGVIVAAMYLLYMTGRVVWGTPRQPADYHEHPELPKDLNGREIGLLTVLAVGCLGLGVYPTPVIEAIEPSVERTLAPYQDLLEARAQQLSLDEGEG
jgi:NADH-quinone oxidoreductase subunit M